MDGNSDPKYIYSVTILKSEATAFHLAGRYVACGTSFRLTDTIFSCTYDVLQNPFLRSCSCNDVTNFIRVIYAVNLQHLARHRLDSWGFSIALDSVTHKSTSNLDLHFRIFLPSFHNIVSVHGAALPCLISILARSCFK